MRMHGKFRIVAALLVAVPSFAVAQHPPAISASSSRAVAAAPTGVPTAAPAFRGASAPIHTGSRVAGSHVARTSRSGVAASSSARVGANFNSNGVDSSAGIGAASFAGDPISLQQLLDPYPAYGFDFEHLNAINRDLDLKAFIDPATQVRIATAERSLRHSPGVGTGSGFYVLNGGGAYAVPDDSSGDLNADQSEQAGSAQQGDDQLAQAQQPQRSQREQRPIIIIQQAVQPLAAESSGVGAGSPEDAAQEEAAPVRDGGEFILVTRDGMEIEAVAFTRVKDKIVYITSQGARYTIALRDLDSDETVRVNQDRGTPLQLPR